MGCLLPLEGDNSISLALAGPYATCSTCNTWAEGLQNPSWLLSFPFLYGFLISWPPAKDREPMEMGWVNEPQKMGLWEQKVCVLNFLSPQFAERVSASKLALHTLCLGWSLWNENSHGCWPWSQLDPQTWLRCSAPERAAVGVLETLVSPNFSLLDLGNGSDLSHSDWIGYWGHWAVLRIQHVKTLCGWDSAMRIFLSNQAVYLSPERHPGKYI